MRKFGPAKEKEETWPFLIILVPIQPGHIATHTAALSAFSSSFHWRTRFGKINSFVAQYVRPPY